MPAGRIIKRHAGTSRTDPPRWGRGASTPGTATTFVTTVVVAPDALEFRASFGCRSTPGCPDPTCNRVLFTLYGVDPRAPPGGEIERECPLKKSVRVRFRVGARDLVDRNGAE